MHWCRPNHEAAQRASMRASAGVPKDLRWRNQTRLVANAQVSQQRAAFLRERGGVVLTLPIHCPGQAPIQVSGGLSCSRLPATADLVSLAHSARCQPQSATARRA